MRFRRRKPIIDAEAIKVLVEARNAHQPVTFTHRVSRIMPKRLLNCDECGAVGIPLWCDVTDFGCRVTKQMVCGWECPNGPHITEVQP